MVRSTSRRYVKISGRRNTNKRKKIKRGGVHSEEQRKKDIISLKSWTQDKLQKKLDTLSKLKTHGNEDEQITYYIDMIELVLNEKLKDSLNRFIIAQNNGDLHGSKYSTALEEMMPKANGSTGKKKEGSHWIWYCFPKFLGKGISDLAIKYAIKSPQEAVEYFLNKELKDRYINLSLAVKLALDDNRNPTNKYKLLDVMGKQIDVDKLHESVSLFYLVAKHLGDETSASTLEGILDYYDVKIHSNTYDIFIKEMGNPLNRPTSTAAVNPFTVDRNNSDVGIQNVGNQCYFISILQAFLSIPEVKTALIRAPDDMNKPMFMALKKICEYKNGEPGVITYRVQDLVKQGVDSIEEVSKTPPEIIKSIIIKESYTRPAFIQYSGVSEEDPYQFLLFILEYLREKEEVNILNDLFKRMETIKKKCIKIPDSPSWNPECNALNLEWDDNINQKNENGVFPLIGQETLKMFESGVLNDPSIGKLLHLQLNIEPDPRRIYDCTGKYRGNPTGPDCGKGMYSEKSYIKGDIPPIYGFGLQRYYSLMAQGGFGDRKISIPVSIDDEIFVPYLNQDNSIIYLKYQLSSLCCHLGDRVDRGHYKSFAKKDEVWIEYNDNSAKPISGHPGDYPNNRQNCYILFYRYTDSHSKHYQPPLDLQQQPAIDATAAAAAPPVAPAAPPLPPGWEKRFDPSGIPYYVDHKTLTSHWNPPASAPVLAPAPVVAQRFQQVVPAAGQHNPSMAAQRVIEPAQLPGAEKPQNATKAVFFDLDETLICDGTTLDVRDKPLKSPYILISGSHGNDIITSNYIIDLLHECSRKDNNTDWYIISKGNNIDKLQLLIGEGAKRGKNINPNGTVFQLPKPIDKANAIDAIMKEKNYQSGIFVDDKIKNCEAVAKVPNITKCIHVKKDWFKFIQGGDEEHPDNEGIIYRPENSDIFKVALYSTAGPYNLSIKLISQGIKDEIMAYVGGVGRPVTGSQVVAAQGPVAQGPVAQGPAAAAPTRVPVTTLKYTWEHINTEGKWIPYNAEDQRMLEDGYHDNPNNKGLDFRDKYIHFPKMIQLDPATGNKIPIRRRKEISQLPAAQGSHQSPVAATPAAAPVNIGRLKESLENKKLTRRLLLGDSDSQGQGGVEELDREIAEIIAKINQLEGQLPGPAPAVAYQPPGPASAAAPAVAPAMGKGIFQATLLFKKRGIRPKQKSISQRCTVVILPNSFKLDTDLPDEVIKNKNHKTHYDYNKYNNSYTVTKLSKPDKDIAGGFLYALQIEFSADNTKHTIVLGFDSKSNIDKFINKLYTSSEYRGLKPAYGGGNKRSSKRKNNKRRSRKKNTIKRRYRRKNTTKKRYSRKK